MDLSVKSMKVSYISDKSEINISYQCTSGKSIKTSNYGTNRNYQLSQKYSAFFFVFQGFESILISPVNDRYFQKIASLFQIEGAKKRFHLPRKPF